MAFQPVNYAADFGLGMQIYNQNVVKPRQDQEVIDEAKKQRAFDNSLATSRDAREAVTSGLTARKLTSEVNEAETQAGIKSDLREASSAAPWYVGLPTEKVGYYLQTLGKASPILKQIAVSGGARLTGDELQKMPPEYRAAVSEFLQSYDALTPEASKNRTFKDKDLGVDYTTKLIGGVDIHPNGSITPLLYAETTDGQPYGYVPRTEKRSNDGNDTVIQIPIPAISAKGQIGLKIMQEADAQGITDPEKRKEYYGKRSVEMQDELQRQLDPAGYDERKKRLKKGDQDIEKGDLDIKAEKRKQSDVSDADFAKASFANNPPQDKWSGIDIGKTIESWDKVQPLTPGQKSALVDYHASKVKEEMGIDEGKMKIKLTESQIRENNAKANLYNGKTGGLGDGSKLSEGVKLQVKGLQSLLADTYNTEQARRTELSKLDRTSETYKDDELAKLMEINSAIRQRRELQSQIDKLTNVVTMQQPPVGKAQGAAPAGVQPTAAPVSAPVPHGRTAPLSQFDNKGQGAAPAAPAQPAAVPVSQAQVSPLLQARSDLARAEQNLGGNPRSPEARTIYNSAKAEFDRLNSASNAESDSRVSAGLVGMKQRVQPINRMSNGQVYQGGMRIN